MKKLISLLAFSFILFIGNNLIAQTNYRDIVYLKNGSIIKGIVLEQIPNVSLKMKTSDGNIFVFEMKDVEKITKEEITGITKSIDKYDSVITTSTSYRSPALSTFLSFLVPGCGQYYNGQSFKGKKFLLWHIASIGVITACYYNSFRERNSTYQLSDQSNKTSSWEYIGIAACISEFTCWVYSMADANQSSKAINHQLGIINIKLTNKSNLSFNPDFRLVNNYSSMNSSSISPTYGLNIRLSF
jgi:hypothetical protein